MNGTWVDILWYLAIGAFFVLMIRKGGCCGGHGHKKSHSENDIGTNDHHTKHQALQVEEVVPEKVVHSNNPTQRGTQ